MTVEILSPAPDTEAKPADPSDGEGSCPEELWIEFEDARENDLPVDKAIVRCRKNEDHSEEHEGIIRLPGLEIVARWASPKPYGVREVKATLKRLSGVELEGKIYDGSN